MERTLDPAQLGDRLYRAAWALCGSREDAEDLVQETYARVLARPRMLRHDDDLGYLLRALRNTFLTQKRTERRRLSPDPLPDQLDLVADPGAREPQAALEAGELYAAIAALPEDFRDVVERPDRNEHAGSVTQPGLVELPALSARKPCCSEIDPPADAWPMSRPAEVAASG